MPYLVGSILLSQNSEERGRKNIWHEENRQNDVIAMTSEVEVFFEPSCLCVPQVTNKALVNSQSKIRKLVPLVKTVEQVHYCQNWQNP